MRRRALLALPFALAAALPPAHAADGVCHDTSGASQTCLPSPVTCDRGDTVGVVVEGHGAGIARCGGVTAFCDTRRPETCPDTAVATQGGTLSCSIDHFQPAQATATCWVLSPPQR